MKMAGSESSIRLNALTSLLARDRISGDHWSINRVHFRSPLDGRIGLDLDIRSTSFKTFITQISTRMNAEIIATRIWIHGVDFTGHGRKIRHAFESWRKITALGFSYRKYLPYPQLE